MRVTSIAVAILLTFVAAAHAAQQTSLPDIEDEVMCVECGTVLSVSNSPVAQQERDFIRKQVAAGKTKQQIKDALVAEYGEGVLATPKADGFNASLWLVPIALALLAVAGIAIALRKWSRRAPEPPQTLPPPLSDEDARRLDAELSKQ